MIKRDGLKKKESKSTNIFNVINDIKIHKVGNLLDDENSENEKSFNNYMALRFLSMNDKLCPLANIANKFQDVLDKKEMYKLLIELIPVTKTFDKYISSNSNSSEYEKCVSDYFQCNTKEAKEFIELMGIDWAKEIKRSFGGQL